MNKITILDGGMGRELKRIDAPFRQPEWSALALMESPEMVVQAHRNFMNAGANIITTNTYALVPFHIGQDRFDKEPMNLATIAIECAKTAVRDTKTKIAGCIPPAFGSYKPELFLPDMVASILTPLIIAQKDHIDFWLIETMSSTHEATAVINLIRTHSNLPIWISFSLSNRADLTSPQTLRSGEPITAIEPVLNQCDAVLFNCSQPEEMEDAIKTTRSMHAGIPIGAYANNFSEIKRTHGANETLSESRDDITPEIYAQFAQKWVDAGATIIGGCCGISPDHITELSKRFK